MYIAKEIPNLTNIVCDCSKAVTAVLNWCNAWNTEGAGETWRVVEVVESELWRTHLETPHLCSFHHVTKINTVFCNQRHFICYNFILSTRFLLIIFRAAWKSLNSRSGAYVICSKGQSLYLSRLPYSQVPPYVSLTANAGFCQFCLL